MKGKTVLITGSTDGIGRQTAIEIAKMGAKVILHARNEERGKMHLIELTKMSDVFQTSDISKTSDISFELVTGDLSSIASVTAMATDIQHRFPIIDVLINNAGVMMNNRILTTDGLETTFQVNYLSHFLLTTLLLDNIKAAPAGRIINVSSNVHSMAKLDLDDLQFEKKFDGYNAYGCSKLEQLISTVDLAEKLKDTQVTVNALHPGIIATKLLRVGWGGGGAPTLEGSRTSVYLATSDEVAGVSGKYFADSREAKCSPLAFDMELQKKLWEYSNAVVA